MLYYAKAVIAPEAIASLTINTSRSEHREKCGKNNCKGAFHKSKNYAKAKYYYTINYVSNYCKGV